MPHRDTPRFLYKFRCLGKHTETLLTRGKLHFEIPTKLDDPFECSPVVCTDCSEEEFRKALRLQISERHPKWSRSQMDNAALQEPFPPPPSRLDSLKSAFQERVARVGVFCASERWDSMVMWSHYADAHQGICLELDTRKLPNNLEFHQVVYQKDRPHVNLFTDWQNAHEITVLRKNDEWCYQAEWRIVLADPPSDPDFAEAPEGFIHGVIFGALMDDGQKKEVRDWVAQMSPRPKLDEASVDGKTYRINIRALPD